MPAWTAQKPRYSAMVCDKDGTLLTGKTLSARTRRALERFHETGRWLLLATGETISQLARFEDLKHFDLVIAENGAVLFWPALKQTKVLAERWPPQLVQRLREQGVEPHTIGDVVVSVKPPNDGALAWTIEALGLDWQVIQNRDEAMVLPLGTDKASGLHAALRELGVPAEEVIGVGDAQNDVPLVKACGLGVAVGSAVDSLKEAADLVLETAAGEAIVEVIDKLLADELPEPRRLKTHFHSTY